jgi:hypothetical protein
LKTISLLFLILVFSQSVKSQHQDARFWTSLSIRYDVAKKWRITLEEETRFYENMSRFDKLNSELTVKYQISKPLDVGFFYRLITNNNSRREIELNNRLGIFMQAKKKYYNWEGSLKTLYQKTYFGFRNSEDWYLPENYIRAEVGISRELKNKKTEPYTNIEFWYRMPSVGQSFVDQYRYTVGVKHKLNKHNRVDFYYRLQQDLQLSDPLTAHIFGVGYQFTIQ